MALTDQAHRRIADYFAANSIARNLAVDATCGNGHDTLFLAGLGFDSVIGFDIQADAIASTNGLLKSHVIDNVQLHKVGHQYMADHIHQPADCIMFNFGYLPGGDKTCITRAETSLIAVDQALDLLSPGGILSLLCYPGHPGGDTETREILKRVALLDKDWQTLTLESDTRSASSPILVLIHRTLF